MRRVHGPGATFTSTASHVILIPEASFAAWGRGQLGLERDPDQQMFSPPPRILEGLTFMDSLDPSGKPLFFKVADGSAVGLSPPKERLGDSLRCWVRWLPRTNLQKEALVISSRTGETWHLASDEGAYLGGDSAAPFPLSFLTAGMVCSYMNEILALAKTRDIGIAEIRLTQDNYYTFDGIAANVTGDAMDIELGVEIDHDGSRAEIDNLLQDAIAASPLNGLMRGQHPGLFTLTHNGAVVEPGRVRAIDGAPLPDPDDKFNAAQPTPGDWSDLMVIGAGSASSADQQGISQSRPRRRELRTEGFKDSGSSSAIALLVHVHGVCTLRNDGVKEVEVSQIGPKTNSYRFLSDEAPVNGGSGRAPDANTYISAGIAFCFMSHCTMVPQQTMADRGRPTGLRVVEDTHFSLGGASGGHRLPGTAEPVETHLHLDSDGNHEFARDLLDGAEQSCFLHAFCRADRKTKLRTVTSFVSGAV